MNDAYSELLIKKEQSAIFCHIFSILATQVYLCYTIYQKIEDL